MRPNDNEHASEILVDVRGTVVQPKLGVAWREIVPACAIPGWSLRLASLRFLLLVLAMTG